MRLINVNTLQLEEFFDDEIPLYTILSHTWGKDEVTFQDLCWLHEYEKNIEAFASVEALMASATMNSAKKAKDLRQRSGFHKIVQSAHLTKEHLLQYVWVDTCCIDKSSSAELSEAINSMFRWYQEARICFVFLSDFQPSDVTKPSVSFAQCRWFTRGWTLQELLAPRHMYFYNQEWKLVGDKDSLRYEMSEITGIPEAILAHNHPFQDVCLAQRMSWASRRQTSRKEDMAYCLLGLFDINMPLLYGEGDMAFVRLQLEIIKETTDQSLLASWGLGNSLSTRGHCFATSPAAMTRAASFYTDNITEQSSSEFWMTNRGFRINLSLLLLSEFESGSHNAPNCYYALLNVFDDQYRRIYLPLFSNNSPSGDEYVRSPSGPVALSESSLNSLGEANYEELVIVREPSWERSLAAGAWQISITNPPTRSLLGAPPINIVETFPPMMSSKHEKGTFTTVITMPPPANVPGSPHDKPWQFFLRCTYPSCGDPFPVGERDFALVFELPSSQGAPRGPLQPYVIDWEKLPLALRKDDEGKSQEGPYSSLAEAILSGARFYGLEYAEKRAWSKEGEFIGDHRPLRAMAHSRPHGLMWYDIITTEWLRPNGDRHFYGRTTADQEE
ncbi:HET domain-containing protein [Colletotrichum melonis]|uniref:HET domain-containing protein n=1 Tax=Colletotrichum melonis TaxID=1209925 RepID=A0AAI9XLE7_9PEZI|nr:HET domain-containing protein [Colletotrichum melonis]